MELIFPRVGNLEATATTRGALLIDRRERGELPLRAPLRLVAGPHRVRIIAAGYRTFETIAVVEATGMTRVDAAMIPLERPPAPAIPDAPVPPGPTFSQLVARELSLVALEIGAGVGVAAPFGNTLRGKPLANDFSWAYPMRLSIGVRTLSFYLGAFAQLAGAFTHTCCADYSDKRFGLEAAWSMRPHARWDPWIGLAIGYEWMRRRLYLNQYEQSPFPNRRSWLLAPATRATLPVERELWSLRLDQGLRREQGGAQAAARDAYRESRTRMLAP